jgi:hypothetical protein
MGFRGCSSPGFVVSGGLQVTGGLPSVPLVLLAIV